MSDNLCFELPEFKIALYQAGPDNFTVIYFKQVESGLDYATAARRLGESIMHALACDSRLDNRDLVEEESES